MIESNDFRRLKTFAKRYARTNRIAQHQALDLVAGQLGFPNWVKLVAASKKGWQTTPEQDAAVEAFVMVPLATAIFRQGDPQATGARLADAVEADAGMIGVHPYRIHDFLHDVVMSGDGWSIRIPENPGAAAIVETYTADGQPRPVREPDFLNMAIEIAKERAARVRGAISTDWPRRSTKPDLDGTVRHPLSGQESSIWFCYHCDGKITGTQIAQNLWHCPGCGASPLDIYAAAFWAQDLGESCMPVDTEAAGRRSGAAPKIVDGRPKLDLTAAKIELLIRSALVEDAANVSERLGALHAEISVDDDNDVWIVLDEDLWPDSKEPVQALAVAALLGIEVELVGTAFTIPFAWPDLGKIASGTREYTRMMLDAYDQHGGLPERRTKAAPPNEGV